MILRGRKQLEGPDGGSNDLFLHNEHDEYVLNDENEVSIPSNEVIVDVH